MAVRTVLHYPDKRLHQKAEPIKRITAALDRLICDMAETMYASGGVGLAAPQIGEAIQLFIVDLSEEEETSDLQVFINPRIRSQDGSVQSTEGCLSFPRVRATVQRAARVHVQALDPKGDAFELTATGLLAIAIQHEYDHLQGILLIDRVGALQKKILRKQIQQRQQTLQQQATE